MKFSGKQLFEMWNPNPFLKWDGYSLSGEWQASWDALAEKLNAMLADYEICAYFRARDGACSCAKCNPPEPQFIDHITIIAETPEAAAVIDEWNREHPECNPATHTRSCREKMEKGGGCSC